MKKKILVLALMLALTAGVVPFYQIDWPTVSAASVSSTDFVIEKGVLTKYKGSGGDVVIPDTVTSIRSYAFYNTSLSIIKIPDSVVEIEDSAFAGCSSLKSINVDSKNSNYASIDGVLFNKNKTKLIAFPGGKSGSYSIPNSVTS